MLLVYMLILLQARPFSHYPFNMYNTDQNQHRDGHCLLYYAIESTISSKELSLGVHQIIPYCLRPSEQTIRIFNTPFNNTIDLAFNFVELREKNITSQALLSWSAAIDLVELYQTFLDNGSNITHRIEALFHNCTRPWFGPYCRFKFDTVSAERLPLESIIMVNFKKTKPLNNNHLSCYKHLDCITEFSCLDWREICDRKIDCLDGSDEFNCWELEINECAENEYRCHNGQCVPLQIFRGTEIITGCLDGTHGTEIGRFIFDCLSDPTFRCEERTCQSGLLEFPCGDGQCIDPFESVCNNGRTNLRHKEYSEDAVACVDTSGYKVSFDYCDRLSSGINRYEFPTGPILFGHVRITFNKNRIRPLLIPQPEYICYDEKLCGEFLPPSYYLHGAVCRRFEEMGLIEIKFYNYLDELSKDLISVFQKCLIVTNETHYCNHSTMYQCLNSSKCISKHRLVDGMSDCPFNDDETYNQSCFLNDARHRIACWKTPNKTCVARIALNNGHKDCLNGEDELSYKEELAETHVHFPIICDGKTDLLPVLIDDRYETDETECSSWPCDNTYSRCDGFWRCRNGMDEVNCPYSGCPNFEHDCIFVNDTSRVSCLPINRADDGIIDCIGASDERYFCQDVYFNRMWMWFNFRCRNDTNCTNYKKICNDVTDCPLNDDEMFCHNREMLLKRSFDNYFSGMFNNINNWFKISNMPNYKIQVITDTTKLFPSSTPKEKHSIQISSSVIANTTGNSWRCNRGLRIHIRMNDNTIRLACLCPPSYYGDSCEYQNQRVSLSLRIQATSDWRNIFTYVIILMDDEGNIESYDHIDYLAVRHCSDVFNVYLLYKSRPRNESKAYAVHIHAFNKITLKYRASWIFFLRFLFLPVHRLPVFLIVPMYDAQPIQNCPLTCIHGQCFRYVNNQSSAFCQCESGWSGIQCSEKYAHHCASDSLCIGKSICVCPLGRFGPQCRLSQTSCDSYACANGGMCLPADERYLPRTLVKPTCICRPGFVGHQCEIEQTVIRIDISFHDKISIPSALLLNFIAVSNRSEPSQTSIVKKVGFDEETLTIYTATPFNIVFAKIFDQYYLIILREQLIVSAHISTQIIPSHRCASIYELFNVTLANQHLLKRIKHYHRPCQERLELVCFYDSIHFCLCNVDRQANCLESNHYETYNCGGYSLCESESDCFLDDSACPSSSICACQRCYFGSKCQFSTKGSSLSLDIILGYRISPNVGINQQPTIIKVAIVVTTIMLILGLLSNLFAFLVFRTEEAHKVGCGVYLLASSIICTFTLIVFGLRLTLLLVSKIGGMDNRLFAKVQCISMDFILRSLLSSGNWLNSCVSVERAVNIWKGVYFSQIKSKQIARWTILVIVFFVICTHIHDPIHRRLIDDDEEQRTWCITQYSLFVKRFDWVMNIWHSLVPFAINCMSAFTIIILAARLRSTVQKGQTYKQVLREQFHQHKHLLISSGILIVLTVPKLFISYLPGCMNSTRDSSFYLGGYFISFISPMLTFIIFVLPSKMYREQFNHAISRFSRR